MPEQQFVIQNIRQELSARTIPAVTIWNRLEGRPRTLNFDRALKAEIRDALWLLTRQWQMGEFRGDDAGSPVLARVHLGTTRLLEYQPDDHDAEPFEYDVPLETKVERRPIRFEIGGQPVALDLRLLMGRQWIKLLGGLGYEQAFIPIRPSARMPTSPRTRSRGACSRRLPGGAWTGASCTPTSRRVRPTMPTTA
jgi:hypothetical protein